MLAEPPSALVDVAIVGAGSAGLSASLILGRSRRRVRVVDGGPPRNAPAHTAGGVFTRDGTSPLEIVRLARADLAPYSSVEVHEAIVTDILGADGAFRLTLSSGELTARKVLLATGVVDELPDRPGVAELWGGDLFHCPYCHGWEARDRPLAIWANASVALHLVTLLRGWTDDLALLTDGPAALDAEERATLAALGVPVYEGRVAALEHDGGQLRRVRFADGSALPRAGVLAAVPQRERSGLPARLGCTTTEDGFVEVDDAGRTSVAGVWAAGDLTSPMQAVTLAAARGATAAFAINRTLALEAAARAAAVTS